MLNYVPETTGPFMLYRLYNNYPNKYEIYLTPSEFTSPLSKNEITMIRQGKVTPEIELKLEEAYAVHYFEGSWYKN